VEGEAMMRRALVWLLLAAPSAAFAADVYVPGAKEDPHVREAQYLMRDHRTLSAAIELRLSDRNNDPLRMPEAYQWRLAESYLGFGLRDRAEAIYRNLAASSEDKDRIAKAQLDVAEFDYQRGYLAEARATLYKMREVLPESAVVRWQDLLARVLLAESRYGEAADTLTELNNAGNQSSYTRFNLGVALINDGRTAQGQTVLDRVGRLVPDDLEDLALRDRANTSLGWHFLQNQQGGTAKPVFSRVRVEGPFSNRALLGLGWAELAPQGDRVVKAEVGDEQPDADPFTTFSTLGVLVRPGFLEDDIFKRAGLRAFSLKKASREETDALKRALVPWVELISRDPMDTAVQEAWLAIPFTLDRLGAYTQALQYYEKAVGVLENAHDRMDKAMESIKRGRMVETIVRRQIDSEAGRDWKLRDLPDAPETYFLQSLLAEHRFQEALKNYRDVRMMSRNLEAWQQRLATVERAAANTDRADMRLDQIVERRRAQFEAPWTGLKIQLQGAEKLSAPGTAKPDAPSQPAVTSRLQLSGVPSRFNGVREQSSSLNARIGDLREQLAQAGAEQARLLQDMSVAELQGQQRQIERYLVEARFALARLYDRQIKGELDAQ
jgi:tetratricopeptide (TPR) repeat protein